MIINEEVVEWAKNYDGPKFHALLSDPPYHLTSIVKRFGRGGSAPAKYGNDGAFGRVSKGFMGQKWDGGDIAFDLETWKVFKNIMFDGAFGMAFASSRGWHRMAVAIEDAGFIIHPTIFGWAFGSGFPKGTRIDTRIDKVLGEKREVIGDIKGIGTLDKTNALGVSWQADPKKTAPASKLSETWSGHRYGLQALKPAIEPIIVFQKPYKGKPIINIVETGAGTFNIEGARIGKETIPSNRWKDDAHPFGGGAGNEYETIINEGRWPSNFILLDEGAKEALGEKAKFYYYVEQKIDTSDPIFYSAKANKKERNNGLEGMKKKQKYAKNGQANSHEIFTSESATDSEWAKKNPNHPQVNIHPTVKPIELNKYLATILLPPEGYKSRRLFVPFAGVMSEAIGAKLAGWDDVTAVEMSEEYCEIGHARVKHWVGQL